MSIQIKIFTVEIVNARYTKMIAGSIILDRKSHIFVWEENLNKPNWEINYSSGIPPKYSNRAQKVILKKVSKILKAVEN